MKDIIPAKVEFIMTLLNNSDNIKHDLDHMMYHMGNLITLKQSVIDSVTTYIEQNRNFIQNLIGREFQFDSFFRKGENIISISDPLTSLGTAGVFDPTPMIT